MKKLGRRLAQHIAGTGVDNRERRINLPGITSRIFLCWVLLQKLKPRRCTTLLAGAHPRSLSEVRASSAGAPWHKQTKPARPNQTKPDRIHQPTNQPTKYANHTRVSEGNDCRLTAGV